MLQWSSSNMKQLSDTYFKISSLSHILVIFGAKIHILKQNLIWTKSNISCAPCRNNSKFCLFQGDQKILTRFYNGDLWGNLFSIINLWPKHLFPKIFCPIIFYIMDIWATFEFFQHAKAWLWYSMIFQQEVDPHHMASRKSVNIRSIPQYAGKNQM